MASFISSKILKASFLEGLLLIMVNLKDSCVFYDSLIVGTVSTWHRNWDVSNVHAGVVPELFNLFLKLF